MKLEPTPIPDCLLIHTFQESDERGLFVKLYNSGIYAENLSDFHIKEIYYSLSKPKVFRGFHFQLPPHDHAKIVFCNFGAVIDYVVDLRTSSQVYGVPFAFKLNDENRRAILIPKGCAHGFYVIDRESMLTYVVETEYSPNHDSGILWSSVNYDFEFKNPILSDRDKNFIALKNFDSPFK